MVKKHVKFTAILFIICCLCICLCSNVYAFSHEEVDTSLQMDYVKYYDDQDNQYFTLFGEVISRTSFNLNQNQSPIGAEMYANGVATSFKLKYGSVLPGIILFNTFQTEYGFLDSSEWILFFTFHINDNAKQTNAYNAAIDDSNNYFHLGIGDYITFEQQICEYSNGHLTYFSFSDDFIQFLYRYCYWLVYNDSMFTGTFDEFMSITYRLSPSTEYYEDIARNPDYYTTVLYSCELSDPASPRFVPIETLFRNFAYNSNYQILGGLFSLAKSDIHKWLPAAYRYVIGAAIAVLFSVTSLMFVKKIVPGA